MKFTSISRSHIIDGRERRSATPAAARHFVATMRGLFKWAIEFDLVSIDPTKDVKVNRRNTPGFAAWTEDDIATFQDRWPIGTRVRVAFEILLYTGLWRGDAVRLGRQHIRDGVIRIDTEKTDERVFIRMCPELAATLKAGAGGRPMVKEAFGNWFGGVCRATGIAKSAHGLRKAAATRDANLGFSESELEAKFGWRGGRMANHYTRAMNRERLAVRAQERAENIVLPHPSAGAAITGRNAK